VKILRVDSLTLRFGALAAVNDLSFELEEGEILGIAGPNGAGKTTLFNAITGFYKYTGDIFFYDDKISGLRPHQICQKGIARTFQIPQLFSTLSVYDNLRMGAHFGARMRGAQEAESIKEVTGFLGLEGKEGVGAAGLNLFDKKLTMLGATLLTRAKVLLVDEPTAGLSPTETTEFIALFKKINETRGISIIIIEHLMKVLTQLSQRMLIMENGKKVTIGCPVDVCRDEKVIEIYLGRGKHA
jgi:branched-chain amino acid transport system ATP-binding protein